MGYWLVLFGAVVTLVCFILHQRGVFRFVYLSTKIPGPSLWTLLTDYAKDFFGMGEMLDVVSHITRRSEYKPWGLWMSPSLFMVIISDTESVGELLSSKNFVDKCDVVYKLCEWYLGGVLITLNGETFKRHRKALLPGFKKPFLEPQVGRINTEAATLVEELRTMATGDSVDVRLLVNTRLFMLSLSMFTSGTYKNSYETIQDFMLSIHAALDMVQLRSFHGFYYSMWLKHQSSVRQIDKKLAKVKECSRKHFLEELHARAEAAKEYDQKPSNMADLIVRGTYQGNSFDEDEAYNETVFLLLAGAETSGFVINCLLVMLALHQDVQERVFREIESVLGDRKEANADDLANMHYLEMAIKENVRLFPVAPAMGRMAAEETTLNGLTVPKGATVVVNVMDLQRNPAIYEDPLKFDPDRFLPEAVQRRSPFSWLGFSHGYRMCPGQLQGMFVVKTIVFHIVRNYRLLPGVGLNSIHDLKFKMSFDWHLLTSSMRLIPRHRAT